MSDAIPMRWVDGAMHPLARFAGAAAERYEEGGVYPMAPVLNRSPASHRHYFACVADAWANLPEDQGDRFPSSEHLRAWALIEAGYCDQITHVCASKAEAQRLAVVIRPLDSFALIVAREATVTIYRAKSQSERSMGRAEFQRSKDDVLRVLAELIGADPAELGKAA